MFLEKFLEGLPGEPSFDRRRYRDKNPASRRIKMRALEIPNEPMVALHEKLMYRWLRRLDVDLRFAVGSVKGGSPLRNVRKHLGHEHIYTLDLKDAYLSVNGEKLAEVLCRLDQRLVHSEEVVFDFLQRYCLSANGGLPVGFPASPDLFNIYVAVLIDQTIGDLLSWWQEHWRQEVTFSRYLDDFTFSSDGPIGDHKRRSIRRPILESGFQISHWKSQVLQVSKAPIVINGIGVRFDGKQYRTFLPGHLRRRLHGILLLATNEDVDPIGFQHLVSGMWGLFIATTGKGLQYPTRTEQNIRTLYAKFQERLRRAKRRASC